MRTLAGATDGYAAVNSNDIGAGFRRVADRLTSYYLLGYYSTNTLNDGKFRKIDVKVTRPGVSVAARRGYLAPPSPEVVAAAQASAAATAGPPVPDEVASVLEQLARLGSDQEVFASASVRGNAIDVVADLAERDVDRGRWAKGASVEATVTDAAGATTTGKGVIEPGRRSTLVRVPFTGEQKGPWRVRLRVTDGQASVETRIDAEGPAAGRLAPPLVLRGAGPPRAPMQPVAELAFRRNERLRIQWPLPPAAGQPAAQILDRRGQPLGTPLPATSSESSGERVVDVRMMLGSLAPGDYVIQLTAGADRYFVPFRLRDESGLGPKSFVSTFRTCRTRRSASRPNASRRRDAAVRRNTPSVRMSARSRAEIDAEHLSNQQLNVGRRIVQAEAFANLPVPVRERAVSPAIPDTQAEPGKRRERNRRRDATVASSARSSRRD